MGPFRHSNQKVFPRGARLSPVCCHSLSGFEIAELPLRRATNAGAPARDRTAECPSIVRCSSILVSDDRGYDKKSSESEFVIATNGLVKPPFSFRGVK